jgi:uncharacterized protein
MQLPGFLSNPALIAALVAWGLAQIIKVPVDFLRNKRWDWTLLLRAGGMPSSHSALVAACAHSIGLFQGFDTPVFALAAVFAMVVIYDATGIRRQAGKHAEIINSMIRDLAHGHPLREEQLREVLGHTPLEAISGTIFGLLVSQLLWMVRI